MLARFERAQVAPARSDRSSEHFQHARTFEPFVEHLRPGRAVEGDAAAARNHESKRSQQPIATAKRVESVMSLVTIAIPTYDRLEYLKEAVASARTQTHGEIEILIGDDGTSREIEDWSTAISSLDSRVRYQRNQRNLGMADNWNALADAARGEFIVIIGDDDRLLPNFVQSLVKLIHADVSVA